MRSQETAGGCESHNTVSLVQLVHTTRAGAHKQAMRTVHYCARDLVHIEAVTRQTSDVGELRMVLSIVFESLDQDSAAGVT
jgi:hypothetical protein